MKVFENKSHRMLIAAALVLMVLAVPIGAYALDYIIVPILSRSAGDLVDQVAPFLSPDGVVSADPGTNSLIIMGSRTIPQ